MKIADYGKAMTSYIEAPTRSQKNLSKLRAENPLRTSFAEGSEPLVPQSKPKQLSDLFERINRAVLAVRGNIVPPEFIVPDLEALTQEYIGEGLISGKDARQFALDRKDYWDKWIKENPKGTTPTFDFDNEGNATEVGQEELIERINEADGGRIGFQFGGGKDAQMMGTQASRKYFKERKVNKPTPVFEGPAGGAKLTDVKFANKTQEAEYIKLLKDRFKFPKGSKEARKISSNADLANRFGITLNNVERVNKALINKLNLNYPTQTYGGYEKIQRDRDKLRKENIKKTSSTGVESKIKRDIKKIDSTALATDVDIAHRASLKANANLGANYLTTSLGIDSKIVNQSIIKPIEQKLGTLYENQKNLIKDLEPGKVPKDIQKQLEKINIKISELADRTDGVLQGVLVDEKTLKPRIYGIDYSKVLGFGLVDKPVSELTQADRDLIKLNIGEQIKAAKKPDIKSKLLKAVGTGAKTVGRVIKPLGIGFGVNAVKNAISQADEMGIELSPLDYAMAFDSGDAGIAINNYKRRTDPEFAAVERAKDLAQMTDDFEEVGKTTFGKYNDEIKNIKLP